ncbi:MAG: hypothetical protein KDA22_11955 [Phycisphaerales bacterium]|nr:hypothetical protein [Phycisphaerales bacterium]
MVEPTPRRLGLFEGYGVELEYMIVSDRTLDVLPVCDRVIEAAAAALGQVRTESHPGDVGFGELAWSNELALHVLEMKTDAPVSGLDGLAARFQDSVRRANALLRPLGGRLLPGGMHPWMDPFREMRLWPHEYGPVYHLLDRLFDCRGHGWANLQSVHLNLPFADDEEFGRLHAAIRLLLPILPAIAASSPAMDGAVGRRLDHRLDVYRSNAKRMPVLTGAVVPEPVFSEAAYSDGIYARIDEALAAHDPERILNHIWMNARGAIARFDRGAIEIRVLDIQERPAADLAVLATIASTLKAIVEERWSSYGRQKAWPVEPLHRQLLRCIDEGEQAVVDNPDYLAMFGLPERPATAQAVWRWLVEEAPPAAEFVPAVELILDQGPLARRLLAAFGPCPDRERLVRVYRHLADCLEHGDAFDAGALS